MNLWIDCQNAQQAQNLQSQLILDQLNSNSKLKLSKLLYTKERSFGALPEQRTQLDQTLERIRNICPKSLWESSACGLYQQVAEIQRRFKDIRPADYAAELKECLKVRGMINA